GRTGGNRVPRWYSRSATVGAGASAPAIQSAKVTPAGACQVPAGRRRHSSGAASAYRPQAAAGSGAGRRAGAAVRSWAGYPTATGPVRVGSMSSHARIRADAHPVSRPAWRRELANSGAAAAHQQVVLTTGGGLGFGRGQHDPGPIVVTPPLGTLASRAPVPRTAWQLGGDLVNPLRPQWCAGDHPVALGHRQHIPDP